MSREEDRDQERGGHGLGVRREGTRLEERGVLGERQLVGMRVEIRLF